MLMVSEPDSSDAQSQKGSTGEAPAHSESPAQFRRIKKLYQAALDLPAEEREAFLKEQCGDDADLRNRLRALLSPDGKSSLNFDQPEVTVSQVLDSEDPAAWEQFLDQLRTRGPAFTRYVDEGEVARGGMGAIRKVHDQDLRRTLAMKVTLAREGENDRSRTEASLGRFLEEAQVTSQLDHPGIVPVHEVGVDDRSRVYFTMKLVRGEDLRSVFDRVRDPNDDGWNQTRALSALLRVCEAMAYAHAKGVIHRDLKPANVMVGKYGETYVMDWGLAKVLGREDRKDLRIRPAAASTIIRSERRETARATPDSPLVTMDGDVVGTPAYMSPEQALGRLEEMGPHSDVYAIGAMLYQLLTGQMPFVASGDRISPHMVLMKVQDGPPRPVPEINRSVPPELVAICEKAMSRKIADRYPTMVDLARDLRAYLENRVVQAYESGPFAELKKWLLRHQGIAVTAAAAAVVFSAVLWWSFDSIQSERDKAQENEQTAVTERDRADENARMAERNAEEMGRLSDAKTLSDLKAEMNDLWPAHPDKAQPMRDWLGRADTLLERKPLHEQTLKDLRAIGTPTEHPQAPELAEMQASAAKLKAGIDAATEEEERSTKQVGLDRLREQIRSLEATIQREQPHEFEGERLSWWHETLVGLVSGLVAFSEENPYGETVVSVRQRLEFAETIENQSITYYQEEWDEALASIADPEECPLYGGLEIKEQLGLVPIERDPESGLWEFWHVQTGEKPRRDENGKLELTEETGLVFVLIPGGTFWMGAQATDPEGRNYDPDAVDNESDNGRPVEVALDAYFFSKYELTQFQWQHIVGKNPSYFSPGSKMGGRTINLLHPVELISWEDCADVFSRLDLRLPTEAQWEYACRAGTETFWWTGTNRQMLDEAGNLADQYCKANGGATGWQYEPDLDDGFVYHAPVGHYRANAFGLHDVVGNVWEWCQDSYRSYQNRVQPGDGLRNVPGTSYRVIRGGGCFSSAVNARSAFRNYNAPDYRDGNLGVRPAIRIISG